MAKTDAPKTITLTYDLFELPTAQHRAGLAGLLLQIDSMKNRKKLAPTWTPDEQEPNTKVHVTFTAETTQSLFDDAYAAEIAEEWFPQKKKRLSAKYADGSCKLPSGSRLEVLDN